MNGDTKIGWHAVPPQLATAMLTQPKAVLSRRSAKPSAVPARHPAHFIAQVGDETEHSMDAMLVLERQGILALRGHKKAHGHLCAEKTEAPTE